MNLLRIAARVATTGNLFYVDWEGRGYTPEMLQQDIDIMKKALGDGPFLAGASEDFMGQFFGPVSAETLLPTDATRLRGGPRGQWSDMSSEDNPDESVALPDIAWETFQSWDEMEKAYDLFGRE